MAATYTQLPISVRDVFSAIVEEVSDNLSTEGTLSIDSVTFYCETWLELIQRLEKEGRASMTRYPFIAVIRNFDFVYDGENRYPKTTLTIVIVTPSTKDKYSEDRESENYVPILRPIYAELMSVMKDSSYFLGYSSDMMKHTYTESLHLGTDSEVGNRKYMLPDVVDGIIVSDLELRVRPDHCESTAPGPTTSLIYLNNVSELTIAINSTSFTVTLVSAGYTDTLSVGYGEAPIYSVYTSHDGGTRTITVGASIQYTNISNENYGDYTGYIYCSDGTTNSRLYFIYTLTGQGGTLVRSTTSKSKFVLSDFFTGGTQYTDYPFDVTTWHRTYPASQISSQYIAIDSGNTMWEEYYSPATANTASTRTEIVQPLATGYRDVTNAVTVNETQLENISYYKQI